MTQLYLRAGRFPAALFAATVDYIASMQSPDGAIAWYEGGPSDPWDHVEAAMGLTVGGRLAEARRAYRWLERMQRPDGSWLAAYLGNEVADGSRAESNFVAYLATGLWHYYLCTGDRDFLGELWPTLARAIEFVLRLQSEHGEIYWCRDTSLGVREDALVTGCSSIYKSLECAIHVAALLGRDARRWRRARERLGYALRHRPDRFDRTWPPKSRYSMDWFYPVLAGVHQGPAARRRLAERWPQFVEEGIGCRCVADEPWVTVAESSELVMALLAAGERRRAAEVFSWLHDYRSPEGAYWTGWVFRDRAHWPLEKPTWTAAAVLLAADALTGHTGGADLFTRVALPDPADDSDRLHYR